MAVLAFLALTEAGLAMCPVAQAHAMIQLDQSAQAPAVSSDHRGGAMTRSAMQAETPECHSPSEPAPAETQVCTECSGGMSCGECALLTAAETPSFDAAAPPLADRHKASLGAVAPVRPLAFDPPPPKA
jgi:hypothetical protein